MNIEITVEGRHLPVTEVIEIDDEELEGLDKREAHIDLLVQDTVYNIVNWGWVEVE